MAGWRSPQRRSSSTSCASHFSFGDATRYGVGFVDAGPDAAAPPARFVQLRESHRRWRSVRRSARDGCPARKPRGRTCTRCRAHHRRAPRARCASRAAARPGGSARARGVRRFRISEVPHLLVWFWRAREDVRGRSTSRVRSQLRGSVPYDTRRQSLGERERALLESTL